MDLSIDILLSFALCVSLALLFVIICYYYGNNYNPYLFLSVAVAFYDHN